MSRTSTHTTKILPFPPESWDLVHTSSAFGHGSETIVSSPSRREVALASEDGTRGLADPPFQLWYETTFSSSLSTLNCSCTFCRRRLWHSVRGHCFPDQVRAVLDEPDPARSSFLIWSCPNVEFFFLLCIFHHRRSHLVFVAGEAVLSPNLHEAAVGAGSAVTATCSRGSFWGSRWVWWLLLR